MVYHKPVSESGESQIALFWKMEQSWSWITSTSCPLAIWLPHWRMIFISLTVRSGIITSFGVELYALLLYKQTFLKFVTVWNPEVSLTFPFFMSFLNYLTGLTMLCFLILLIVASSSTEAKFFDDEESEDTEYRGKFIGKLRSYHHQVFLVVTVCLTLYWLERNSFFLRWMVKYMLSTNTLSSFKTLSTMATERTPSSGRAQLIGTVET